MSTKKQKRLILLLPEPSLYHSDFRIAAQMLWSRTRRFATPKHLAIMGIGIYLLLSTAFTASFFLPRSVTFSYAGASCFTSPTLLPNLISKKQGATFTATPSKSIAIAGYPLYSHTTCVAPTQPPKYNAVDTIAFK